MRIAMWGIGNHARRYLIPALTKDESEMRLVGCYTRNIEKSLEICGQYDLTQFNSEDEMLTSEEVDGILLATPTKLHSEQGISVLKKGKHLFSEKSLYLDHNFRNSFSKIANERGKTVNELFMFKFHPQYLKISELIQSGKIGEAKFCNISFTIPHLSREDNRYNPNLGGGALLDIGCYPVAFVHSMFGGQMNLLNSLLITDQSYEVDTSGFCTIESEGVISNLVWGFGLTYTNKVEIFGTKGNLVSKSIFSKSPDLKTSVEIYDSANNSEIFELPPANHFELMFNEIFSVDGLKWVLSQSEIIEKIFQGDKLLI